MTVDEVVEHRYAADDVRLVAASFRPHHFVPHAYKVNPYSPGSQLADGLLETGCKLDPELLLAGRAQEISAAEHILWKPRWSAFFHTRLLEHLAERPVTTVVVAGCNYPNCPRATLVDATERDLRTVAVRDAISGWTSDAEREMPGIGVVCMGVPEVVAALGSLCEP